MEVDRRPIDIKVTLIDIDVDHDIGQEKMTMQWFLLYRFPIIWKRDAVIMTLRKPILIGWKKLIQRGAGISCMLENSMGNHITSLEAHHVTSLETHHGWFIIRNMDGYLRGALVKLTLNDFPALEIGALAGICVYQLSQQV